MPELPEVEVIKLGLQKRIIGLKIQKIQVVSARSFIGNPNEAEGQKVLNIWRRAKILGIDLSSYQSSSPSGAHSHQTKNKKSLTAEDRRLTTLLFHLKMSGQLIYEDEKRFVGGHPTTDMLDKMPNSHTRVIFSFSDGSHLYFNDQRKFGWVRVIENGELKMENLFLNQNTSQLAAGMNGSQKNFPEGILRSKLRSSSLGKLGPEPLEKEFSWQVLKQNLLKHKNMPAKVAIMDQSVIAGVGNIYANEACFIAKIDPRIKVKDLGDKQFQALFVGIMKSLKEGIHRGGSTRAHFVDSEGHKGYFLDYAFVYGRDKQKCKVCGTNIKKITLGGRGTYFCSSCQR